MTSVRKRKMARSSVRKNTRRVKDKQRNIKMTAHPVMAEHWDKKLTLKQNYKKLGLAASLGHLTGGREKKLETVSDRRRKAASVESDDENGISPEKIAQQTDPEKIPEGEARLIRDPETNEVVKVIYGTKKLGQEEEPENEHSIIQKLEQYTREHAKPTHISTPSDRQSHWLSQLHAKYGEDYEKMKWDKKLNPTFMSSGQLKKKIASWKRATGTV